MTDNREKTAAPPAPSPAARGENAKLAQAALERDRSKVAECLSAIKVAIERRRWLTQAGRGSYAYDDERYQREFGAAIEELEIAIEPLNDIAHDWSNCPQTTAEVASALASRPAPQAQVSEERVQAACQAAMDFSGFYVREDMMRLALSAALAVPARRVPTREEIAKLIRDGVVLDNSPAELIADKIIALINGERESKP